MIRLLLIFLGLVFLTACTEDKDKAYQPAYSGVSVFSSEEEYVFGVHPLHNPKRLHEIFGPIARYLTENIPGAKFRIEASRNYAVFDKKLYAGKFDFALPNPYQTVNSLKHGYEVFAKMADDENFRGIFLVRKDSAIRNVEDLKGHAVSFPAPTALAATMMPQYYLQTHGINVMKDIDIRYVGSQESSIMNVMLGDTSAGATWPPPWRALAKERPELQKQLKVIWQTAPLPSNGLVAHKRVDQWLVKQVKRLLLHLHLHEKGRKWLEKMELSRFEDANDKTYQPVEEFIDKFDKNVRPIK